MRRSPIILVLMALGLATGFSVAWAQCPEDVRLRAEREIGLTDTRIDQAESRLALDVNEAARAELGEAVRIQAQAKSELALSHCRVALDLTLRARVRLARVVAIVRGLPNVGVPDPGRVLNQLDRTQEQIERARDRIEECDNDRARAVFHAADEMQQRAEASFQSDRFLAALQLTVGARERAWRALRQCHLQENAEENVDRALKRTDEILAHAQDQGSEDGRPRARRALARARELQDQAYREFRGRHFDASLRLTQSARTFAHRAIRSSNSNP